MKNIKGLFSECLTIFSSLDITFLGELLNLSEIEFNKNIETASIVERDRKYKIYLNPDFISKHINTPYKLAAVLLHECLHHILGHFLARPDFIRNIAFDSVINSMIYHMDKRLGELFKEIYDPVAFPECILRPESKLKDSVSLNPVKGKPPEAEGESPPGQSAPRCATVPTMAEISNGVKIYNALWYPSAETTGITWEDIYAFLKKRIKVKKMKNLLLGSHKKEERQNEKVPFGKEFFENINTDVFSKSPLHERILKKIKAKYAGENRNFLQKLFLASLEKSFGRKSPNRVAGSIEKRSVIPSKIRSRRDIFLLGCGLFPAFFKVRKNGPVHGEVVLYVDVSASVNELLPFIYALLRDLSSYLSQKIYLFSQEVAEVSRRELLNGKIDTTGGTSFDCVGEHLLKNKIRKALIITDGLSEIEPALAKEVKEKVDLTAILTQETNMPAVRQISRKVFILPDELAKGVSDDNILSRMRPIEKRFSLLEKG